MTIMKPVNPEKEQIIVLVNRLLERSGLSIDQVIARMQIYGCDVTRNTFENRFTTRVHQKPNISAEWLFALIHALSHNLQESERCTAEEALELFQLARLALDHLGTIQHYFSEIEFARAIEKLVPLSYFSISQTTTEADNLLTDSVSNSSVSANNTAIEVQTADWGDAPDITKIVGRDDELAELHHWINEDSCHLIGIFGMGGVGKTVLAAIFARSLCSQFQRIYWSSLRTAPTLHQLLGKCLGFLLAVNETMLPTAIDQRNDLFFQQLRTERVLLIFDGCEHLMEAGDTSGTYRAGYENYGQWFHQLAKVSHTSRILLVGREKPVEFTGFVSELATIHTLFVQGLDVEHIHHIATFQEIDGNTVAWQQLHDDYSGNPFALKLAAELIQDLFGGEIAAFLESNATLFQHIHELLDEQFSRLSLLEREILYWLVIERNAVTLDAIQSDIGSSVPKSQLLEALRSLLRRSLVEQQLNMFAVPTIIQIYIRERLIELIVSEIDAGIPLMMAGFPLLKTHIQEYLRDAQIQEIIHPILERLLRFSTRKAIEEKLLAMIHSLQQRPSAPGNYCAGNLFTLLRYFNTDLRCYDFFQLDMHQADLRIANLQNVNFTNCTFHASRFWETFASIAALAYSPNGALVAAGMTDGEIYLWSQQQDELRYCLHGHTDMIWSVVFSQDGTLLATGGEDCMVRVWDVASGECLLAIVAHNGWVKSVAFLMGTAQIVTAGHDAMIRIWDVTTGECIKNWNAHDDWIWSIAVSPDNQLLATAGQDHKVKLWKLSSERCLHVLTHHTEPVRTVAFSPNGKVLMSAGFDQMICLWDVATGECHHHLQEHQNLIWSAAFSPDGRQLASGGDDPQIFLWDALEGTLLQTFAGHQNRLWALAFHPNGEIIASGGDDQRLAFWQTQDGVLLDSLAGYSNQIWAIAYDHDSQQLASGGDDGTVRLWDHQSGQCTQVLQGHSERVRGIAFHPTSPLIATGGDDHIVRIWDIRRNVCLHTLQGHQNRVWSVAYDATGQLLVSCSEDQTIRLWNAERGQLIRTLHTERGRIWSIACHPTENLLASSGDGHEILLWDLVSGQCIGAWEGQQSRIWHVTFNADGSLLASGGADHTICLWERATGKLLHKLEGHTDAVWAVAFSPDGTQLASGSDDQTICLWDVGQGNRVATYSGHSGCIWTLTFLSNTLLASGGQDETIRLWETTEGTLQQLLHSERPYEGMNITGIHGLTEAQKASLRALGAVEDL